MSCNEKMTKDSDYDIILEKIKLPNKSTKKILLLEKKVRLQYMLKSYEDSLNSKPNGLIELSLTLAKIQTQNMIDLIDIMLIDL